MEGYCKRPESGFKINVGAVFYELKQDSLSKGVFLFMLYRAIGKSDRKLRNGKIYPEYGGLG